MHENNHFSDTLRELHFASSRNRRKSILQNTASRSPVFVIHPTGRNSAWQSATFVCQQNFVTETSGQQLLQLRVLGLGLLQDGDVGVSAFPEREEILVGGVGFYDVALQRTGPSEAEMRQRADGFVTHNAAMIQDFLEFGRRVATGMRRQIRFPAHIHGIESERQKAEFRRRSQLVRSGGLKDHNGSRVITSVDRELSLNG